MLRLWRNREFSSLARSADERFHMVEVAFESAASSRGEAIFRFGHASFEGLEAGDIRRILEPSRVHTDVAVGGLEQFLEVAEGKRFVDGESADDAEPHALVDKLVEVGGAGRPPPAHAMRSAGFFFGKGVRSSHRASSRSPGRTEREDRRIPRPYTRWPRPAARTEHMRRRA